MNFKNTGMFSDIKGLEDISLELEYGSIVGFTTQELKEYFSGYIENVAVQLWTEPGALLKRLTGYYDGYCFEKTATVRVMNPWSILSFLNYPTRGFRDHWFQTGGQPSILKEFFRSGSLKDPKNFTAVKSIPLEQFGCPAIKDNLSDVDLLTQTGYLSIKSADGNIAIVDYSTEEVRHVMAGMYLQQLLGKSIEQAGVINFADGLARDNPETLVYVFNRLLGTVDYEAYSIEDARSVLGVIQVAMSSVGLLPVVEENAKEGSVLEVKAGERSIVLALEYCHPDQEAERLLQDAVGQLEELTSGMPNRRNELLRVSLVFSEIEKRIVLLSVGPPT